MTHKAFYEAAAAEVAQGHLDNALWIKVNAELPAAADNVRQAKYIALRAQELATANAGAAVRRWLPRSAVGWVGYVAAAFVVGAILATLIDALSANALFALGFVTFWAVPIIAVVIALTLRPSQRLPM